MLIIVFPSFFVQIDKVPRNDRLQFCSFQKNKTAVKSIEQPRRTIFHNVNARIQVLHLFKDHSH